MLGVLVFLSRDANFVSRRGRRMRRGTHRFSCVWPSGCLLFLTTDYTAYTDASLAECELCLTQRAQNAQRCTCCACAPSGCLLCCPRRTRMVTNLLSTDDTDDTDFCTCYACALGMYISRVAALPISSADVLPRWSNALLYSKLMAALLLRGESACPGKHA